MNCDRMHLHLDAYLQGDLAPGLRAEVEDHLRRCEECREVVATLREDPPRPVVLDVVARTTGSNCGRIRESLARAVDRSEAPGTELREHLEDCARCRAVAEAMDWSRARLPRLATVEPDADFTADVLMATLDRPRLGAVFALRLRERLGRWLDRPLVAQEMAFAFTVLLVLLTSTPWSPMPGLPERALEWVQLVGEARAHEASTERENWSLVQAVPPLRYAAGVGGEIREAVQKRSERAGRDLRWVGAGLGETGHGVIAGEGASVRGGLKIVECGLESLWIGLRAPQAPPPPDCAGTRPGEDERRDDGRNGR